jgi:hypothetical protein
MEDAQMSRWFRLLPLLLMLCLARPAAAGTYRVQFAGTFDATCFGTGCTGSSLLSLAGTPFTGEFVFPDAGLDLQPGDPELGTYVFSSAVSSFRFDSTVDDFDVTGPADVTVGVYNCIGDECPALGDLVLLSATVGNVNFDLSLSNYGPAVELLGSDAIPSLDLLQSLAVHPAFSIASEDYSAYVEAWWDAEPEPLAATVSAVPAPPAAGLLLTGLAILLRRAIGRPA